MAYHCPHCKRNVLSRRSGRCGYCLEPLPSEMLLTADELETIEAEERERERCREERDRAKQWEYETIIKSPALTPIPCKGDEMTYHCPHCKRNVLSRRSGRCGYCLEPLPSEMLLTAAELETIEAEERERERCREERDRAKQRNLQRFINRGGGDGGG